VQGHANIFAPCAFQVLLLSFN